MNPIREAIQASRRELLGRFAGAAGPLALLSLLKHQGVLAAEPGPATDGARTRAPHFTPKARNCIFIFLEGAPSQLDLYDPKPKLNELHGQLLPESMTKNVRFAFIQKETARVMGSPRKWAKHGDSGMDLSDYLPHLSTCVDDMCLIRSMHTEAFNHHPAQLLLTAGSTMFGRPTMGAWLNYGLGSEAESLPGYVVLTAGRGTSGGASLWSSGFLPSDYAGVLFRSQGDPVLNLTNPAGLSPDLQRRTLDAVAALNAGRSRALGDPEIDSRIASYELAYRMQTAAPELIDLAGETKQTLDEYGVDREDLDIGAAHRGGGPGQYRAFARNCLLARRLVERGVRFVSLYHASWDHHSNLDKELAFNAGMADQPVAALLKDLKRRGLLDQTVVIFAGEFGRTPLGENRNGNPNATGRDHHPFAFSLWCAGGGIRGDNVIGRTDELGWSVVEDPVHLNDFHATLLKLFGLGHLRLTHRFQGRDFRLTDVGGKIVEKMLA